MSILFILLSATIVVAGVAIIARSILGPIEDAARLIRRRRQFTISDIACLFILVQIVLGLAHATVPSDELIGRWVLGGFGGGIAAVAWWISVGQLSRAGIESRGTRALFLLYVLPVTYVGSVAFMTLLLGVLAILYTPPTERTRDWLLRIAFVEAVLFVCLAAAAAITQRMQARATAGLDDLPRKTPPAVP